MIFRCRYFQNCSKGANGKKKKKRKLDKLQPQKQTIITPSKKLIAICDINFDT